MTSSGRTTQVLSEDIYSPEIAVREGHRLLILSPKGRVPRRRVLFVNSYGGRWAWKAARRLEYPVHHLWGCPELVQLGYEVGLVDPLTDFNPRHLFPHDLYVVWKALWWLRGDGILYCGHNLLFWAAILRRLGILRCRTVGVLFGRESLRVAAGYSAIVGLTPAATAHARKLAPRASVAHLGWGVSLPEHPMLDYQPKWFLSCGKSLRDFSTLSAAATRSGRRVRIVGPASCESGGWPANVEVASGKGSDGNVTYSSLVNEYYAGCIAALVILGSLPGEQGAPGFTNMIEAMALGRPVIVTRTGALAGELDIEAEGCGLFVPPGDVDALVGAMECLARNPREAAAMGRRGRILCERHYNIVRFASDLHSLFEAL